MFKPWHNLSAHLCTSENRFQILLLISQLYSPKWNAMLHKHFSIYLTITKSSQKTIIDHRNLSFCDLQRNYCLRSVLLNFISNTWSWTCSFHLTLYKTYFPEFTKNLLSRSGKYFCLWQNLNYSGKWVLLNNNWIHDHVLYKLMFIYFIPDVVYTFNIKQ